MDIMSNGRIKSLPGTEDLMPGGWAHWRALHEAARGAFELFGYGEVRTPIIEPTCLFVKGTGETTDIVEKQMYTMDAGEGESVTLRPEGTPSVVRAYQENNLHKREPYQKFWYAGPMFRRERPQKGRLRQFHQIGVEAIGSASPLLDAETLMLARDIFEDVGLKNLRVLVNSIGCAECRPAYRGALRGRLGAQREELCEDCRRRVDRNVLRVLDCKEAPCKQVAAEVPLMGEFLCGVCRDHHAQLRQALDEMGVAYEEDAYLVRGLDYYTRTVYEIKHAALGARDTICGGGRYDALVEQLGGPATPCVGFAMGVEATMLAMEADLGTGDDSSLRPSVFVVCFEREGLRRCFELVQTLRARGVSAEMDYEAKSAKAQMRRANRLSCPYCFLIGEHELSENLVLIKAMADGRQWSVAWADAASEILRNNTGDVQTVG
ncbi:MAG: histidine--tRNA ligase [Candidatus Brocadiia bacterium]|jgi:histidyl-tRNA synthetase|nr:histidine--tRNA ligase [Candidatus Brocadiia bacterium]